MDNTEASKPTRVRQTSSRGRNCRSMFVNCNESRSIVELMAVVHTTTVDVCWVTEELVHPLSGRLFVEGLVSNTTPPEVAFHSYEEVGMV